MDHSTPPWGHDQAPAIAVDDARNRKLGNVSTTHVSQASCPPTCPWRDAGCYAEGGPQGFTTRRLNRSAERNAARIAHAEARAIDALSARRLLRGRVVGDSRTDASARI